MKSFDELILKEDRLYDDLRRAYSTIHALTETALGEEFFRYDADRAREKAKVADRLSDCNHAPDRTDAGRNEEIS